VARVQLELAQRHAAGGVQVRDLEVLHHPAGGAEQAVDLLPCTLLGARHSAYLPSSTACPAGCSRGTRIALAACATRGSLGKSYQRQAADSDAAQGSEA
jgi:hypothetical protein